MGHRFFGLLQMNYSEQFLVPGRFPFAPLDLRFPIVLIILSFFLDVMLVFISVLISFLVSFVV